MAIKRSEIGAQIRQVEKLINAAKQMIGWNVVVKVERVEQAVLIAAVVSLLLESPLICSCHQYDQGPPSSRLFQQHRPIAEAQ